MIVVVMFLAGVLAGWIAPFDPEENDFNAMMEAPSLVHWLGTDQLGRDIFSRLVYGARTALIVGFSSAVLGGVIGLVMGVASAYFGGWFDLVFQRVLDVLMAFPLIILALAVVAVFGTGVFNVIIAITIPLIPRCGRVVRASALAVREVPYVDAARALGFSHARIVLRHMVPNVLAPFLILLSAFVGQAILAEASLSYLGPGVQEPVPAWGLMDRPPWRSVLPSNNSQPRRLRRGFSWRRLASMLVHDLKQDGGALSANARNCGQRREGHRLQVLDGEEARIDHRAA